MYSAMHVIIVPKHMANPTGILLRTSTRSCDCAHATMCCSDVKILLSLFFFAFWGNGLHNALGNVLTQKVQDMLPTAIFLVKSRAVAVECP